MKTKALEIRDEGTFIPALAIDMNPGEPSHRNRIRGRTAHLRKRI